MLRTATEWAFIVSNHGRDYDDRNDGWNDETNVVDIGINNKNDNGDSNDVDDDNDDDVGTVE